MLFPKRCDIIGACNLTCSIIASNSAMFDHISKGRFILGISAGALRCDAEALGHLEMDRNKLFAECITD